LVYFTNAKEIPDKVKAALQEAAAKKRAVLETQQKIGDVEKQLADIAAEQGRIRENMKTVDRQSAYYTRLAGKLNDQESTIETLQTQRDELRKSFEEQSKALADYLGQLTVE
jgi:predicted RNase H-like nuclease (RuvC/YqgF family)